MGRYLKNILVSLDQLANTLLAGNPDETLSSRAYHLRKKDVYWPSNIINGLFFQSKDHCKENKENIK